MATEIGEATPKSKAANLKKPWKPGQSGNPNGRPKGSRGKLCEDFLRDFHEAWEMHGAFALREVAKDDPSTFVRVAASLLPKEYKVESVTSELTDEQLDQRLKQLARAFDLELRNEGGVYRLAGGEAEADRAH
jgi:hypothetical protein